MNSPKVSYFHYIKRRKNKFGNAHTVWEVAAVQLVEQLSQGFESE